MFALQQTLSIREKFEKMSMLCSKPSSIFRGGDLRCKYKNKNSPFLRIAPLKQEIISSDPKIIIFREVLSDAEIKKFMKEGQLRVKIKYQSIDIITVSEHAEVDYRLLIFQFMKKLRSQLFKEKNTPDKSSKLMPENRLNEVEFIRDDEFKQVSTLTDRVRDMTGFHENLVQPWQITLYGVGGFFYEHSDVNLAVSIQQEENFSRSRSHRSVVVNFIILFCRVPKR